MHRPPEAAPSCPTFLPSQGGIARVRDDRRPQCTPVSFLGPRGGLSAAAVPAAVPAGSKDSGSRGQAPASVPSSPPPTTTTPAHSPFFQGPPSPAPPHSPPATAHASPPPPPLTLSSARRPTRPIPQELSSHPPPLPAPSIHHQDTVAVPTSDEHHPTPLPAIPPPHPRPWWGGTSRSARHGLATAAKTLPPSAPPAPPSPFPPLSARRTRERGSGGGEGGTWPPLSAVMIGLVVWGGRTSDRRGHLLPNPTSPPPPPPNKLSLHTPPPPTVGTTTVTGEMCRRLASRRANRDRKAIDALPPLPAPPPLFPDSLLPPRPPPQFPYM